MRLLFLAIFLIVNLLGAKDCNAQTGTFIWTNGAPTTNPGVSGARFAVDRATFRWYEWVSGTSWVQSGDRIQRISGCAAPAYTPTIHNAYFVVNGCTEPEFYYWNGAAWKLLNGGGGATYTAGTGIYISGGNVISADTSILATQYDISQLGATFPLLAPTSSTPNYSFENSTGSGLFFENTSTPTLNISGEDDYPSASVSTSITIKSGRGLVGGTLTMSGGESTDPEARGGTFIMSGGSSTGENGEGGELFLNGGSGTFIGGNAVVIGGQGDEIGGDVRIEGGIGGNGAGNVSISSATSTSGNHGNVFLRTGNDGGKRPVTLISAGLQYSSLTTTERNALTGLTEGRLIWNTTTKSFNSYDGTTWHEIPKIIKASATLDFPSTGAHSGSDLTVTVTGAAIRDGVVIQPDPAAILANACYTAWVSAANTVTVRYNHYGSGSSNPASNVFDLTIIKR